MYAKYEDFADYFKKRGFNIREATKTSLYLHFGNDDGKVGIQVVQTGLETAEIALQCELASGHSVTSSVKIRGEMYGPDLVRYVFSKTNDDLKTSICLLGLDMSFCEEDNQEDGRQKVQHTDGSIPGSHDRFDESQKELESVSKGNGESKYKAKNKEIVDYLNKPDVWNRMISTDSLPEHEKEIIRLFHMKDGVNPIIHAIHLDHIEGGVRFEHINNNI